MRPTIVILAAALAAAAPARAQDDGQFEPLDVIEGEEPLDTPEDQVFEEDVPFDEFGNPIDPNAPLREGEGETVTTVQEGPEVTSGTGAVLRGLDKLAGSSIDLDLSEGETGELGWLQVTLAECRYPTDNPQGDAFAHLVIRDGNEEQALFDGWMVASSPALSALDHSRFDVWVMRCTTE
ncbi:DUF2155 domain-containing protein [uncultured Maritimibacter sp.]|uniref:DUF2155 domain-containing protein n=1 Tax=Maritimibacter sp. UBA3975 TaxID=1946833 RepID=UPI000C0A12F2|nr:hypothetical protein [Maritimibacter sp.]|tara:strand:- start:29919 stop:30458 length:540 start_codon:yes stop_codon:yes gene_type:complete